MAMLQGYANNEVKPAFRSSIDFVSSLPPRKKYCKKLKAHCVLVEFRIRY